MENRSTEQQYQSLVIIWGGLLFSQITFLVILFFVKPGIYNLDFTKPFLEGENSIVILSLGFVAVVLFALSFILSYSFKTKAISGRNPALIQTALVLGCALCEACSLIGFAIAMAFDYQYFFIWFFLGIAGVILHYPQKDGLISANFDKL